jgi:hypothetical protein
MREKASTLIEAYRSKGCNCRVPGCDCELSYVCILAIRGYREVSYIYDNQKSDVCDPCARGEHITADGEYFKSKRRP